MTASRTRLRLLTALTLLTSACIPTAFGADDIVPPEQQTEIDAAGSVDDLTRLARQFLLRGEAASAGACIEKMCRLSPELLTDGQRQSPRSWNAFWFAHRARMREAALAPSDAAGRTELARWLYDAGLGRDARDMLRRAIAIDEKLPAALTLAEEWNLYGGGPVQFDLRLGLTELLIRDAFRDEGRDITPRRERAFLLVPFRYDPGETRLTIRANDLKVATDEGRGASAMGIVLLEQEATTALPGRTSAASFQLKLASDNEPVWEQIQINQAEDKDEYELTCLNLASPRADRRRGRRSDRSAQADRSTRDNDSRRQTRTGSGYAAFLVEVPLDMKMARCVYRDEAEVQIDVDLVKALAEPFDNLPPTEQRTSANVLISRSTMEDGAVARATAEKLAGIRKSLRPLTGQPSEAAEQLLPHIDRALVKALGHRSPAVRQAAFSAIIDAQDHLPETTFAVIQSADTPEALLALLDQIADTLAASDRNTTTRESEPPLQPAPQIPGAVYDALRACLQHDDPGVRRRAVIVAVSDRSKRGSEALAAARPDANELIADQLQSIRSADQKVAIARSLVAGADAGIVVAALDAIKDVPVPVAGDDDPFIEALSRPLSAEAMTRLLGVLNRSDLSAVAASPGFATRLTEAQKRHANDAAVQAAILALALQHFDASYRSPLYRDRTGKMPSSAFEPLLAQLAAGAPGDASQTAAAALLQAGRLAALQTSLRQASPATRQDLVKTLAQNEKLAGQDALPMFVAGCLADEDKTVQKLALASLALIYKNVDQENRWRVNMGIRQVVQMHQLIALTVANEPTVTNHAFNLIVRLTGLTDDDQQQFLKAPDAEARSTFVDVGDDIETRAGTLGSLVVFDIASADDAADPAGRCDIPVVSDPVRLQLVGETELAATIGERSIGKAGLGDDLQLDVAPLLMNAIRSARKAKAEWVNRVATGSLEKPISCRLKRQPFGGYAGEVSLLATGSNERPLRIVGAGIILEPMHP